MCGSVGAYDLRERSASSAMIAKTNITIKLTLLLFGPKKLSSSVDKDETHIPDSVFCWGTSGLDIGQLTVGGFL